MLSGDNTFITHDGAIRIFLGSEVFKEIGTLFGPIAIRNNCFIGYRANILPNVIIGPNSVIGAGSVILKIYLQILFMQEIQQSSFLLMMNIWKNAN